MTVIIKYVNPTIFKEIHKMYPQAYIVIDYAFPETASIDLVLVPSDLMFTAKLDLSADLKLQEEIEKIALEYTSHKAEAKQ